MPRVFFATCRYPELSPGGHANTAAGSTGSGGATAPNLGRGGGGNGTELCDPRGGGCDGDSAGSWSDIQGACEEKGSVESDTAQPCLLGLPLILREPLNQRDALNPSCARSGSLCEFVYMFVPLPFVYQV